MYSASTALLEALTEAGVDYIFANLGSDHPGILESIAEAKATGRKIPQLVTSPHEMVAMSCAHGYAQVTGKAQAVIVHVECGTQNIGGAIHNAHKGRTPVFIFAGASPYTQEGELTGSRNEFIHWIQDVFDQRGIVREYMRYDNEFRTGVNIKQITHRAMQFAHTDPQGPVYLTGPREVMEEEVTPLKLDMDQWEPLPPSPMLQEAAEELVRDLMAAKRPLIVTSYVGRKPDAVPELVKLAERLGIGVYESVPSAMNFPATSPMHQGLQWNDRKQNEHIAAADLIVVLDSDVPWIQLFNKPAAGIKIWHLDVDPLKETMPLFYLPAQRRAKVHPTAALKQLNAIVASAKVDEAAVAARKAHYTASHDAWQANLRTLEVKPTDGVITIEYLMGCLRKHIDKDTIVMDEAITNDRMVYEHLAMTEPGSIFTSGAGSLGWNGGAAVGAKMAAPDKTVINITGDGSFMFSAPATVHWMARHCKAPFLQIVLNNRGWRAPKFSMLGVHPTGYASKSNDLGVTFDEPADYAGIAAAAGGARPFTLKDPDEVESALAEAVRTVKEEGRCAVLDVWIAHL